MTFKQLNQKMSDQFDLMSSGKLFRSEVTGQEVWNRYISSFNREDDPVFRDPASTTHTCNNDKNFIRRYGNIVSIVDGKIVSMFDIDVKGTVYENSVKSVKSLLSNSKIKDVFVEEFAELHVLNYEKTKKTQEVFQLGVEKTLKIYTQEEADKFGVVTAGKVYEFNHFFVKLPTAFVDKSGKSAASLMGDKRDNKNVLERGLKELSLDALETVRDLIQQGSILNAESQLSKVESFIKLKQEFDKGKSDNWIWETSLDYPYCKFKNELIGTLCSDISSGVELNEACLLWNKRVDPANYMKAVAPVTQRQINDAEKFVVENGYEESFDRSFANIEDINVSEIVHINEDKKKTASLFTGIKTKGSEKPKSFDNVPEISIEKFMQEILPVSNSLELFVENKFVNNFVALTKAKTQDSKPIFKWSNNFGWTYINNLTGKSELTKIVESKGGRTDGVFRFTHSWNEIEPNQSLMDLHVFMPGCIVPNSGGGPYVEGRRVGWNKRTDSLSGGIQDVDYTSQAPQGYIPVENITFPKISTMPEGVYTCKIHNWDFRGSGGKGKAEIAFGNEVFEYIYPRTSNQQWVTIAEVTLKNGEFTIKHFIEPVITNKTQEVWGVKTNEFCPVNLVCNSPNYWGENNVGNKHYLFMLEGCHADTPLRSFHNEFLCSDLVPYRKVMEPLGNLRKAIPTGNDLSGIGFNSTVRESVIIKAGNKMFKVNFNS